MSKKVFITGGTGFLGAYIIKSLVAGGYQVTALRRGTQVPFFIAPDVFGKVSWVQGDLFDVMLLSEAMEGMDAVIHAAAKVSLHPRDREELYHTNVTGTANVVNAALERGVPRLIYISSIAAIGRAATGAEVTENHKWDPETKTTHYAQSKYRAELEVWRGMAEGLDTAILNPSTILGFGDWDQSSCAIFKNVYREFPWYTLGINGFVDVEDVAGAALRVLESNLSGERYIVSGENWSFVELFNAIADGFHKKRPYRLATPLLSDLACTWEALKATFSGQRPLLTRESARVAHSTTRFSNRKILEALPGFSFTPLHTTIEKACAAYLMRAKQAG